MLSKKIENAINDQIHAEFFSFYLYLAMSGYFKTQHLDGFAHWMHVQAQEEYAHAMKLFEYLNERGGTVALKALDAPQQEWQSPVIAFEQVLQHEQYITGRINELLDLANQERDHATAVILHWYVNEQIEEEATADTLYHQVKMLEGSPHGMFMLDRELAARPAVAAAEAPAEA
jgi:ferritin